MFNYLALDIDMNMRVKGFAYVGDAQHALVCGKLCAHSDANPRGGAAVLDLYYGQIRNIQASMRVRGALHTNNVITLYLHCRYILLKVIYD
jgi:hypothetical protein